MKNRILVFCGFVTYFCGVVASDSDNERLYSAITDPSNKQKLEEIRNTLEEVHNLRRTNNADDFVIRLLRCTTLEELVTFQKKTDAVIKQIVSSELSISSSIKKLDQVDCDQKVKTRSLTESNKLEHLKQAYVFLNQLLLGALTLVRKYITSIEQDPKNMQDVLDQFSLNSPENKTILHEHVIGGKVGIREILEFRENLLEMKTKIKKVYEETSDIIKTLPLSVDLASLKEAEKQMIKNSMVSESSKNTAKKTRRSCLQQKHIITAPVIFHFLSKYNMDADSKTFKTLKSLHDEYKSLSEFILLAQEAIPFFRDYTSKFNKLAEIFKNLSFSKGLCDEMVKKQREMIILKKVSESLERQIKVMTHLLPDYSIGWDIFLHQLFGSYLFQFSPLDITVQPSILSNSGLFLYLTPVSEDFYEGLDLEEFHLVANAVPTSVTETELGNLKKYGGLKISTDGKYNSCGVRSVSPRKVVALDLVFGGDLCRKWVVNTLSEKVKEKDPIVLKLLAPELYLFLTNTPEEVDVYKVNNNKNIFSSDSQLASFVLSAWCQMQRSLLEHIRSDVESIMSGKLTGILPKEGIAQIAYIFYLIQSGKAQFSKEKNTKELRIASKVLGRIGKEKSVDDLKKISIIWDEYRKEMMENTFEYELICSKVLNDHDLRAKFVEWKSNKEIGAVTARRIIRNSIVDAILTAEEKNFFDDQLPINFEQAFALVKKEAESKSMAVTAKIEEAITRDILFLGVSPEIFLNEFVSNEPTLRKYATTILTNKKRCIEIYENYTDIMRMYLQTYIGLPGIQIPVHLNRSLASDLGYYFGTLVASAYAQNHNLLLVSDSGVQYGNEKLHDIIHFDTPGANKTIIINYTGGTHIGAGGHYERVVSQEEYEKVNPQILSIIGTFK